MNGTAIAIFEIPYDAAGVSSQAVEIYRTQDPLVSLQTLIPAVALMSWVCHSSGDRGITHTDDLFFSARLKYLRDVIDIIPLGHIATMEGREELLKTGNSFTPHDTKIVLNILRRIIISGPEGFDRETIAKWAPSFAKIDIPYTFVRAYFNRVLQYGPRLEFEPPSVFMAGDKIAGVFLDNKQACQFDYEQSMDNMFMGVKVAADVNDFDIRMAASISLGINPLATLDAHKTSPLYYNRIISWVVRSLLTRSKMPNTMMLVPTYAVEPLRGYLKHIVGDNPGELSQKVLNVLFDRKNKDGSPSEACCEAWNADDVRDAVDDADGDDPEVEADEDSIEENKESAKEPDSKGDGADDKPVKVTKNKILYRIATTTDTSVRGYVFVRTAAYILTHVLEHDDTLKPQERTFIKHVLDDVLFSLTEDSLLSIVKHYANIEEIEGE